MKKLCAISTVAMLALSGPVSADGYYNLFGPHDDEWGKISFQDTINDDTVWLWPTDDGEIVVFIRNPDGGRGDWSKGTYDGYFTVDLPSQLATPCDYAIDDAYGNTATEWGTARFEWTGDDAFTLYTWHCGNEAGPAISAQYDWNASDGDEIIPVAATLRLQSDHIPLSVNDPAYTDQGLDKNPAIYLDVEFSDGSSESYDYKKFSASNIVFDDVSGDPNDIIEINYWDVDPDNPGLGQYAAQLTSTGKGVGTAELFVTFRDAPDVKAAVTATVVSAAGPAAGALKVPVSGTLALQSYTLPLSRNDPAYTVSGMDLFPAIYVTAEFADRSSFAHSYQKDFAENVVVDDISGDPYDLIEVVPWAIDDNNHNEGTYAGQLTSTGNGVGTAILLVSFKNAPGVTATVLVTVVSGAN